MVFEINPTNDIAWSSSVVQTHTCGNKSAAHRKKGRKQEEQLALLSKNEITYVDQSRNFGAKTGLESNTGDRSTINMLHNPYNPKNTTIFYSNIMRTPTKY